jgi:sulfur-oxidizing protein SoxZ
MAQALLTVPTTTTQGEVVEVRALIAHAMETGHRPGDDGKTLPRNIITRLACTWRGQPVFAATLYPSVSANPYVAFYLRTDLAPGVIGQLEARWEGDRGFAHVERATIRGV